MCLKGNGWYLGLAVVLRVRWTSVGRKETSNIYIFSPTTTHSQSGSMVLARTILTTLEAVSTGGSLVSGTGAAR